MSIWETVFLIIVIIESLIIIIMARTQYNRYSNDQYGEKTKLLLDEPVVFCDNNRLSPLSKLERKENSDSVVLLCGRRKVVEYKRLG